MSCLLYIFPFFTDCNIGSTSQKKLMCPHEAIGSCHCNLMGPSKGIGNTSQRNHGPK